MKKKNKLRSEVPVYKIYDRRLKERGAHGKITIKGDLLDGNKDMCIKINPLMFGCGGRMLVTQYLAFYVRGHGFDL